jgi:hypothetical protein
MKQAIQTTEPAPFTQSSDGIYRRTSTQQQISTPADVGTLTN